MTGAREYGTPQLGNARFYGRKALEAHAALTHNAEAPQSTQLSDMLTDLLCFVGVDAFNEALGRARSYYASEATK